MGIELLNQPVVVQSPIYAVRGPADNVGPARVRRVAWPDLKWSCDGPDVEKCA